MFHVFAIEGSLNILTEASREAGSQKIEALIFFRDPASHILSLYKHRSKSGKHANFEQWVAGGYETMSLVESFLEYRDKYNVNWICRKYKKDSVHLTKVAFVDWLNVPMPEIPENDRVNSSLTLSEILVLQQIRRYNRDLVPFLRSNFTNIPVTKKADDTSLNKLYCAKTGEYLKQYVELFSRVNNYLPEQENLEIKTDVSNAKEIISLSRKQLTAIASLTSSRNILKNRVITILKKIKSRFWK